MLQSNWIAFGDIEEALYNLQPLSAKVPLSPSPQVYSSAEA